MADDAEAGPVSSTEPVAPRVVEYDRVTGVPSEYNEYLAKDSEEYKKWKSLQDGGAEAMEALTLKDKAPGAPAAAAEGASSKSSKKKKSPPQIVLEMNTRNKKKSITVVSGLDGFKVKLSEASKVFGKKFATGASVTKTASGGEQIEMQGDFVDQLAELIIAKYGASNDIPKAAIYVIQEKKKVPYYDEESDE